MRRNLLIGALAAAAVLTAFAAPAAARTLRWASQGDILTFDGVYPLQSLIHTVDPKGGRTATSTSASTSTRRPTC